MYKKPNKVLCTETFMCTNRSGNETSKVTVQSIQVREAIAVNNNELINRWLLDFIHVKFGIYDLSRIILSFSLELVHSKSHRRSQ